MEHSSHARRVGIAAIVCAVIIRFFDAGIPLTLLRLLQPYASEFLIHKQTGRNVRSVSSIQLFYPAESPAPLLPAQPEPETQPVFLPEDAEKAALAPLPGVEPDVAALLTAPMSLELAGEAPTVLILHTHTTESYTPSGEAYEETVRYRTLDGEHNMLRIGDRVAELLEAGGIHVLHDRELHDYPNYNTAYSHARKTAADLLRQEPGIRLVLDLHRDAMEGTHGQLATHADIGGQDGAQLMLVMGVGHAGLPQPHWEENLSLALKLQVQLERQCPGITRPIDLRNQRFNQDLSPGALLVEVGSAGNTLEQALLAADQLAEAILRLNGQ